MRKPRRACSTDTMHASPRLSWLALLFPAISSAQEPARKQPAPAPTERTDKPETKAAEAKPARAATGYGFGSPAPRKPTKAHRRVAHVAGPSVVFPGFSMLPDGGSRVFIQLSDSVPIEERKSDRQIIYVLKGAHLNLRNNRNALVTVHFNTPVASARLREAGRDLQLAIELRAASSPTFKIEPAKEGKGATLNIDFPKGEFVTDAAPPPEPKSGEEGEGTTDSPNEEIPSDDEGAPTEAPKKRKTPASKASKGSAAAPAKRP